MTAYAIYSPPRDASSASAGDFRLVADAKSIFALILPVVWLLWNRLWLAFLAYLVAIFAIALLTYYNNSIYLLFLSSLPALFLFLEGSEMKRASLERRGWHLEGFVEAANSEEAEIRYLMEIGPSAIQPAAKPEVNTLSLAKPVGSEYAGSSAGIFPE